VSYAVVEDNDITMDTPAETTFAATSAAIEIRGAGEGNIVINNRIRGRANFALSVAAQKGSPLNTTFLMNDIQDFSAAEAGLFVGADASNTVYVGQPFTVEDHGVSTVIVPWTGILNSHRFN
jgi:hypothetical protein